MDINIFSRNYLRDFFVYLPFDLNFLNEPELLPFPPDLLAMLCIDDEFRNLFCDAQSLPLFDRTKFVALPLVLYIDFVELEELLSDLVDELSGRLTIFTRFTNCFLYSTIFLLFREFSMHTRHHAHSNDIPTHKKINN